MHEAFAVLDCTDRWQGATDGRLIEAMTQFRRQAQHEGSVEGELRRDMFALVVEATRRSLGLNVFPQQIAAGDALTDGVIVEMHTGEGKTLAGLFPCVAWAALGRAVHVMTANRYLAMRDAQALRPIYSRLGITTACLRNPPGQNQAAYLADVTYGAGDAFGFDYLFEQINLDLPTRDGSRHEPISRACALVDEADSVLIDEAASPLIVSPRTDQPHPFPEPYILAADAVADLTAVVDYDPQRQTLKSQRAAAAATEAHQIVDARRIPLLRPWSQYIRQALVAKDLLSENVDYLVDDSAILFVDQLTGRVYPERSWRDGLHQALQARHRVLITTEANTVAKITRQRFFQNYQLVSGMTGTARSAAVEFRKTYGLPVREIPLRRPSIRREFATRYFSTQFAKRHAILEDAVLRQRKGQPVLVGTTTIRESELLAAELDNQSIDYQILNGKQDAGEAAVIANAGGGGVLTIATNMAGRGADICIDDAARQVGGLHVIAAQRHSDIRIDRQLIGRCARQGDPGSYQFYVSAEDSLLQEYGNVLAKRMMGLAGPTGEIFRNLDGAVREIQRRAELAQARQRHALAEADSKRTRLIESLSR